LRAVPDPGDTNLPTGNALARSSGAAIYNAATSPLVVMNPGTLGITGGGQPHNNMQPYLTLNFCIALQGVYPPRN
jgi:microcystin-dependent protein